MHSLSAVEGDTIRVFGATLGAFVGVLILASLGLIIVIIYLGYELRKGKITGEYIATYKNIHKHHTWSDTFVACVKSLDIDYLTSCVHHRYIQ